LKATDTEIAIGTYLICRTPFLHLKTKNFGFFEDTKNGPTITTLLSLNHHIDFHCS